MQTYVQNQTSQNDSSLIAQHFFIARIRSCTDPLAAIYGLLGVLSNFYPGFTPDYSTTPVSLYARATKYLFSTQVSLQMLALAVASGENPLSLPSWCLDWNRESAEYLDPTFFQAYGSSTVYAPSAIDSSERLLTIEGILVGTVSVVGSPVEDEKTLWKVQTLKNTITSWIRLWYPKSELAANNFRRVAFKDRPVINDNEKRSKGIERMQPDDMEAAKT